MRALVAALVLCAAAASAQQSSGWQVSRPLEGDGPLRVAGAPFQDSLTANTTPVAGYESTREAVIAHTAQDDAARAKLAALGGKPNILIFLLDDVGWGDLGAYGGGIAVGSPTPNMDRAARAGLLLTSTYSQPTCSPTRGSLLTGRLPMRHGLLRPPMAGEPGGLQGEITVANLLSDAGYVTAAVGKWHCGENNVSQPQNVGFDSFLGFLSVSDVYTEWRDATHHPDIVSRPARFALARNMGFERDLVRASGQGTTLQQQGEIDIPLAAQLDDMFANYSVDFITNSAPVAGANGTAAKPWLLYHATRGCHFDNYPGNWTGASPAAYPYTDCVVQMDQVFGRLMDALERTGQANNTFVFISSDNGPNMETWPDAGRTPFRGSKGSTWEGGVRVPGIAYWPGMIAGGRQSDGLFDLMDLFATSATLAGVPNAIPKDRFIDAVDQTGFLLSDEGVSARKWVYYWMQETFSGLRTAEAKFMAAATYWEYMQDAALPGGLSGDITTFQIGHYFNLYLDPKETHSSMIRNLPFFDKFNEAMKAHAETFQRFPPKKVVSLTRFGGASKGTRRR